VLAGNGKGPNLCDDRGGGRVEGSLGRPLLSRSQKNPQTYSLYYGSAQAPVALVVPDSIYPNMYRIQWPDGRLSDLANLTRIKDAAEAISERGPPPRNRRDFLSGANRQTRCADRGTDQTLSIADTSDKTQWQSARRRICRQIC
jgi:hypothetical protein